ncbi:hypothetical protein JXA40_00095 [bacterium]|nr:hypothetical protein [candidate division CSSED10-310 bacterium]
MSTVVPGSGLIYLKKSIRGAIYFAASLFMLAMGVHTIRQPVSNVLLTFGALAWYSGIFDTFRVFRLQSGRSRLGPGFYAGISLAAAGCVVLLISAFTIFMPGQIRFPLMEYSLFPPAFIRGDRLMVRSVSSESVGNLNRSQWVVINMNGGFHTLAIIIGRPGEFVRYESDRLSINNLPVNISEENIPLIRKTFANKVPEHSYLVWLTLQVMYHQFDFYNQGLMNINPAGIMGRDTIRYHADPIVCQFEDIESVVQATIFPSHRRRLW